MLSYSIIVHVEKNKDTRQFTHLKCLDFINKFILELWVRHYFGNSRRTIRGRPASSIVACEEDASRVLSIWLLRRICTRKKCPKPYNSPRFWSQNHCAIQLWKYSKHTSQSSQNNIKHWRISASSLIDHLCYFAGKEASAIILSPCIHSNCRVTSSRPTTTLTIVLSIPGKRLTNIIAYRSFLCLWTVGSIWVRTYQFRRQKRMDHRSDSK